MVENIIVELTKQKSHRLINSKFPPINLFDDVADAEEFEFLFDLQARTNPRILNEVGDISLVSIEEIPFGITGCSYATASFTHVNPNGSRFSDGSFGALYMADKIETAIAETRHHQSIYFTNIEGLAYDTITMRGLSCCFSGELIDITSKYDEDIYHSTDYTTAQNFGTQLRKQGCEGIQYKSVRKKDAVCWMLLTPKKVIKIEQTGHYEFIWDGDKIAKVEKIAKVI